MTIHLQEDPVGSPSQPKLARYQAALVVPSLLLTAFASPLFRTLGFEYSAISGLALSLVCGIFAISWAFASPMRASTLRSAAGLVLPTLVLTSVPITLGLLSLVFIPNCSVADGILFYLEVAVPSGLLGAGFGIGIARLVRGRGRRTALWLFAAFWCLTLGASLVPGYTGPQLWTYGWQYGFFPGFVWDSALELGRAYLFFRIENVFWLVVLLAISSIHALDRPVGSRATLELLVLLAVGYGFSMQERLGITTSERQLERGLLRRVVAVDLRTHLHLAPASMTDEAVSELVEDLRWYLHDIRDQFELRDTDSRIDIYIYPSSHAIRKYVGTAEASIAKPWLGELHIGQSSLGSLKHELAHVLLREKGRFPFYSSWSTGLTEGAAMSVEPVYDGIYTLDENAARILQMGYASGVGSVMSFTGFAANASAKSYVLAGSFSQYLLHAYGATRFNMLYANLDYEASYGKSFAALESEWKHSLTPLMSALSPDDSAHFRYYYDRSSIIFTPCLRRIGKLERRAEEAFAAHDFTRASSLYAQAVRAGGGLSPLVSEATSLLRLSRIHDASWVLDTTRIGLIAKNAVALATERADLHILREDPFGTSLLYDSAKRVRLSARSFLSAYAHGELQNMDIAIEWWAWLWQQYIGDRDSGYARDLLDLMIDRHKSAAHPMDQAAQRANSASSFEGPDRGELLLRYIRSMQAVRDGRLRDAATDASALRQLEHVSLGSEDDSLAYSIIALHFARLRPGIDAAALCPTRYRAAAQEQQTEINRQWRFRGAEAPQPGRETSR